MNADIWIFIFKYSVNVWSKQNQEETDCILNWNNPAFSPTKAIPKNRINKWSPQKFKT